MLAVSGGLLPQGRIAPFYGQLSRFEVIHSSPASRVGFLRFWFLYKWFLARNHIFDRWGELGEVDALDGGFLFCWVWGSAQDGG